MYGGDLPGDMPGARVALEQPALERSNPSLQPSLQRRYGTCAEQHASHKLIRSGDVPAEMYTYKMENGQV